MNDRWDLSFLYAGFDDPRFQADLAAVPGMVKEVRALLDADMDELTRLEKLTDATEAISAKLDDLGGFCGLTLSVDANNAKAAKYDDKLNMIYNELDLMDSAIMRHVGALDNLEELIAASEKLKAVAFSLRESAQQAKHLIPAEIEPWMLEMKLSGGSAFSQLRDKLDSNHTVEYRGKSLPLPAVRGMAYDPDAAVRKDAYEAEIASYKKWSCPWPIA